MPDFILSIDQGTTSTRAILFDLKGEQQAIAQQELPQIFPQPGWVEHDPEEIWRAVQQVCRDAMAKRPAGGVRAIGITNQRETTVVWNRKTGKPIHNAIVWQDRRGAPLVPQADRRRLGAEDPGQDRPADRFLFLRHQGALVPGQRAGRAGGGRARRTRHGHHRQLRAVAPDRRQGARDRRHQRQPHHAVQHPQDGLGRGAAAAFQCAEEHAAQGAGMRRRIRHAARPRPSAWRCRSRASRATSRRR